MQKITPLNTARLTNTNPTIRPLYNLIIVAAVSERLAAPILNKTVHSSPIAILTCAKIGYAQQPTRIRSNNGFTNLNPCATATHAAPNTGAHANVVNRETISFVSLYNFAIAARAFHASSAPSNF